MKTRLHLLTFFLISLVLPQVAHAQVGRDELQIIQALWGLQKKDLISQQIKLEPAEAARFWPVYDQYMVERQKLGAERVDIISDYAQALKNMTDATADDLATRVLKNDLALAKLHKKYYSRFKKVVSPLRNSEFWQMESYLDTAVKAELQSEIPLIGEFRKKK